MENVKNAANNLKDNIADNLNNIKDNIVNVGNNIKEKLPVAPGMPDLKPDNGDTFFSVDLVELENFHFKNYLNGLLIFT